MRLVLHAVAAILVGFATGVVPVGAQTTNSDAPPPGRIHASSYGPIPDGLTMAVRPWDNSAANLRVKTNFSEALTRRGQRVADSGAVLALNFETEIETLMATESGPTLGSVSSRNYGAVPDSRVRMNLWSNSQDSLVTGRRGGESGLHSSVRYVLRATVDDQRSGQRLWQGEASYTGTPNDEQSLFAAMVPVLLDAFGQSVRVRGFRVE